MMASSEQNSDSESDANMTADQQERIAYIEQQIAPLASGADEGGQHGQRRPLAEVMVAAGVPGIGVAVIDGGRVAWARGYGVALADEPTPVTAETLFQCASISKPVAAVMALRLVEAGALTLDGDVNERLTSWRIPAIPYWGDQGRAEWRPRITLRQLISHTAGLTVHGFPGYPVGASLPTLPQILDGAPPANTPPIRVDALPGAQMRYSGGGYTVLTQLLEDVTGKPFAELARELVLGPLGMASGGFEQPLPPERVALAARAHHAAAQPVPGGWHVYPELAPAGLWATPTDLARFALGLQAALAGTPGAILSQATMRDMMAPQAPEEGVDAVGLGVFLLGAGETARFGHTGGNEGFNCELTAYQRRGQGAVVMTNGDGGWLALKAILNTIAEAYEWPDYTPFRMSRAWGAGADAATLATYVGQYADDAGRRCAITQEVDGLRLAFGDQPPLPLEPDDDGAYAVEALKATVTFAATNGDQPTTLTLRQNRRAITLRKRG